MTLCVVSLMVIGDFEKVSTVRPVGFEPTRFGETVGLKSTPLDHSGRSALDLVFCTANGTDSDPSSDSLTGETRAFLYLICAF
jgi:hypothetical protein